MISQINFNLTGETEQTTTVRDKWELRESSTNPCVYQGVRRTPSTRI